MISLALATAFFLGIHFFVSGTALRDAIVRVVGERAFLGLFSLVSLAALVWIGFAYARAPLLPFWATPLWFRPVALVLMLVAFLLVAIGVTTPNPTATGGEARLAAAEPARGIVRVTRHP